MTTFTFLVDVGEIEVFAQFKNAVSDLEQEDQVLIRFLRARNYHLGNAEIMIRNENGRLLVINFRKYYLQTRFALTGALQCNLAVQWRKDNDIDNFLKWDFPDDYDREIAFTFFGKDHESSPILWIPMGKWNGKARVENGESELMLRWGWNIMERCLKASEETNLQGNIVIDLEGLTYSQVMHIASMKLIYQQFHRLEQFYPELIKSITMINAPWVFTIAFNFIKGIITRKTMGKIKIFGFNKEQWLEELLNKFPRNSIVPELINIQ